MNSSNWFAVEESDNEVVVITEEALGEQGTKGIKGDTGFGVAPGGTTGQLYAKASNADYDGEYIDPDFEPLGAVADLSTAVDQAIELAVEQATNRDNHTGTQPQNTIEGLEDVLDAKADLVDGVIPASQIPAIAITEYLGQAANQAAMLALRGQGGDWCIRTDTNTKWIIVANNGSLLTDWLNLPSGIDSVSSVNGQTGPVTLTTSEISEGSRLYFTTERALAVVSDWWQTATSAFGRTLANVADAAAGRTALGLGNSATRNVGTAANTVAAGDDTRIANAVQSAIAGIAGADQVTNIVSLTPAEYLALPSPRSATTLYFIVRTSRSSILASASAETLAYISAVEAADGRMLERAVLEAIVPFANWRIPIGGTFQPRCIGRTVAGALVPMVGVAPTLIGFTPDLYSRRTGFKGNGTSFIINSGVNDDTQPETNLHLAIYLSEADTTLGQFARYSGHNRGGTTAIALSRMELGANGVNNRSQTRLGYATANSGTVLGTSRNNANTYTCINPNAGSIITSPVTASNPPQGGRIISHARNSSEFAGQLELGNYQNERSALFSWGPSTDLLTLRTQYLTFMAALAASGI